MGSKHTQGLYNLPNKSGSVAPENRIYGEIGQLYLRSTGEIWQKQSGANTKTGWVQLAAGSGTAPAMVSFTTIAAQNDYDATDVPALAGVAALTLKIATLDDGLFTSLVTWDGTTFSIDGGVTIAGGESVVAFFA